MRIFSLMVVFVLTAVMSAFSLLHTKLIPPIEASPLTDVVAPLVATHNTYSLQFVSQTDATILTNDSAYVAIDYDSGHVIFSNHATSQLPIASLTKIMSAMVALDLAKPQEEITVSQLASEYPPTKIGLTKGEQLTLDELLHAMLMTSANDAAQAVADGINKKYHADVFIWAMNKKAKNLGLTGTHFASPQGFDSSANYSSAKDLAILTHYALTHYPEIAQIVASDYIQLPATNTHKQYDLYNWNGLLDVYPNISGVKIGNTHAAKYTNVVLSERNGKKVLVVVLGASGVLQRDLDAATLLDSAFAKAYGMEPIDITTAALQAKYATWKYWN